MNISIAIADTNRDYLERLGAVLQEYEDLSVSIFTSAEILERTLQSKRFDIVLFDPDLSDAKIAFYNTKLAICLYSEDARNTALYSECSKVIKFQRISKLYKDIIKEYADKAGYVPDFDSSQNTKMIAVYSPIGGSGKTTIALTLASMFSSLGENVMFLNMEQLDSASCVNVHVEDADGITVLLESLDENTNFGLKLKGITQKGLNGMSYIEGFERIVDFNSISKEEVQTVLEKIIRYGNYDVVIVDMESRLDDIGQAVFEQADKIIVVEKSGEIAIRKMNLFAQQAIACEYEGKMCKIINFAENNTKSENQLDVPCVGKVYNYGNQSLKNIIQMISTKAAINPNTIMSRNLI